MPAHRGQEAVETIDQLLAKGQTQKARAKAEKVLKQDASNTDALAALAKLAVLEGKFEEAQSLVARIETKGETADALLIRATIARQGGKADDAKALYEKARALAPGRAEPLFGLATLVAPGDPAAALPLFERAVEISPQSGPFHLHLAECLLALEQQDGAVQHLQTAMQVAPRYPAPYVLLSRLMMLAGHNDDARNVLQMGLGAMPNEPSLLSALTNLSLVSGDVKQAYQSAVTLAQRFPDDPVAQGNLAIILMGQHRLDEALALCREMEKRRLTTAQLKFTEAMVLEAMDPPNVEGAVAAYEAAMSLDPTDWRAANNLGLLYLREKSVGSEERRASRAITVLEEAMRRRPDELEPQLNLAIAYRAAKQKEKCLETARRVLSYEIPAGHPIREQAERLLSSFGA